MVLDVNIVQELAMSDRTQSLSQDERFKIHLCIYRLKSGIHLYTPGKMNRRMHAKGLLERRIRNLGVFHKLEEIANIDLGGLST